MTSFARNSKGEYSLIEQYGNYAWGPDISWAEGKQFEQYDGTMGTAKMFPNTIKMLTTQALIPIRMYHCKVVMIVHNSTLQHLINTIRVLHHATPLTVCRS